MCSSEVILWMGTCKPEHLAVNRVMLCALGEHYLMNGRGLFPGEYSEILARSNCAGIVKP